MSGSVSGQILGAAEKTGYFVGGLEISSWPYILIDIIIVAILMYWAYRFIRETKALRILYGLIFLLLLMGIGRLLDLVLLNWLLKYVMTMLVVAIPIVFQPELRNALERLGRSRIISNFSKTESKEQFLAEILTAIELLSKQKIGALIILQRKTGLREYIERGVEIDAAVTAELIYSIFFPKSPLHDGAIIIAGDRIVSASVSLPVSEVEIGSKLGMRHRAGIGISESSDAIAVIVSEETGSVSVAVSGDIERRINEEKLRRKLAMLLRDRS